MLWLTQLLVLFSLLIADTFSKIPRSSHAVTVPLHLDGFEWTYGNCSLPSSASPAR